MKKLDKILGIIIVCLLVVLGIGVLVTYLIDPNYIRELFANIVDFINKPLPIVGVTTLAILIFVWKLVITTNYGKKRLQEYDKKVLEIEKAKQDYVNKSNEIIKEQQEQIDKLESELAFVCSLSSNIKIKDYGKGLGYGKETDNATKGE